MPSAWCRTAGPSATNLTGLNATTGVSVAFWLRPHPAETALIAGDIFGQRSTANAARDGYHVVFSSGGLTLRVCGAAANSDTSVAIGPAGIRHGRWAHWCVTFDDATNFVRFYRDGFLIGAATNATDMTANAACTTQIFGTTVQGQLLGHLFDLQVLPDVVVPPQDVPLLMNPFLKYPGVRGRYFGLGGPRLAASAVLQDESGSGNNLTNGAVAIEHGDEPPFRPTYT